MLYLIYGCEDDYEGYHGIEEYKIEEFNTREEANREAEELAYDVIESFSYTLSYYDEVMEDDGDFSDHIEIQVYEIRDTQGHTIEELEEMLFEEGYEEFIQMFRLEG